jgi:hypothetical protein
MITGVCLTFQERTKIRILIMERQDGALFRIRGQNVTFSFRPITQTKAIYHQDAKNNKKPDFKNFASLGGLSASPESA